MKTITRPIGRITLAILMLALSLTVGVTMAAPPARALTSPAPHVSMGQPAAQLAALPDPAALEHFLDGVLGEQLEDYHIPGATVSVVQDGALLLAKGYGYADVARRTPVDPAQTLFRVGSLSKLFTWTAVMQLVEQGKLD
ncbi:MAG: beta-lactamase family protein, partial [Actinomycetota bacterium]|nr:beta-lactamase family protein [Actinomycetota bacterium]